MPPSAPWILLARILRPQGRKGEVLADLFTESPERFDEMPRVWLAPDGFSESDAAQNAEASEPVPSEVRAWWLPVGRNAGRIVMHVVGSDSIEKAEALAGREVIIRAGERTELAPGSFYIDDLIGVTVFDGAESIGVIAGVQFPMTADGARRLEEAASLLEVTSTEGDEVLIPFAQAYLRETDLANKRLVMELPPGLLELNRPTLRAAGHAGSELPGADPANTPD